jgi:hypothetical protein
MCGGGFIPLLHTDLPIYQEVAMKKLINDPMNVVPEALEGCSRPIRI